MLAGPSQGLFLVSPKLGLELRGESDEIDLFSGELRWLYASKLCVHAPRYKQLHFSETYRCAKYYQEKSYNLVSMRIFFLVPMHGRKRYKGCLAPPATHCGAGGGGGGGTHARC